MATIYGTPVILLQKPDTSEQWLINSTVIFLSNPLGFFEEIKFTSNNEEFISMKFSVGD